ncbi:hypothetical protein [Candidatus Thioglobus sp. NP1]|uniref:hypothetical protein n=1 Tax=Candidatus Thioglobus sp. NP1 TaxID=2508687 RepID=UPI000DED39EA|nr:hypothetical protein [Candidatus Thioglobus sp. NP1]AXE62445.1 hypothetical protein CRN91_07265 [Candidatus Thioglobus sp. NP1]
MLDGINYYPRKRKPILRRLIWLFLFFLIFGSIWYYFQDIDLGKSKSKSIIISKPSSLVEIQDTVIGESDESNSIPNVESKTENLDEVISTYETNTQN